MKEKKGDVTNTKVKTNWRNPNETKKRFEKKKQICLPEKLAKFEKNHIVFPLLFVGIMAQTEIELIPLQTTKIYPLSK